MGKSVQFLMYCALAFPFKFNNLIALANAA